MRIKATEIGRTTMARLTIVIALLALVACGGSSDTPLDAAPMLDDAGNPIVDAAPNPNGYQEIPLSCQPYSREVRHAATDGSKDVTINYYALTQLTPGEDFIISTCIAPSAPTCNAGDICMGSSSPMFTQQCGVTRDGIFLDGKLVILCSTTLEHYNSAGVKTTTSTTTYNVRLESR